MGLHAKTVELIEAAQAVLAEYNPQTVRQVFYALVSSQALKNTKAEYNRTINALVKARKDGTIPWEWIEDRLRIPRRVAMWDDLGTFIDVVKQSYKRDVWAEQFCYVEAWVEKDALSGIFERVLKPYGVTLNVGRGYDGWTSIYNAAERYDVHDEVTVLYFGDFDPSGVNIFDSLGERLAYFGCGAEVIRCALLKDDIERYDLPPDFTKASDTRSAAFIEKYGDLAVELDALPITVLRERIKAEVESRLDLDALEHVREAEGDDVQKLLGILGPGEADGESD